MAREWPDYESEMMKKSKAKKRGDAFIVSGSDDEDMKDAHYRATKRKRRGTNRHDYLFQQLTSCSAGLLFQIDVNTRLSCNVKY